VKYLNANIAAGSLLDEFLEFFSCDILGAAGFGDNPQFNFNGGHGGRR
jgi:hypothetical protein